MKAADFEAPDHIAVRMKDMSATHEFVDAIGKLRGIQQQLVAISDRTDSDRKLDLVNLRRELSIQIGIVSNVAEKTFLVTATEEDVRQFRTLLSTMRRAVALHQANFPAVKLDEQSIAYDMSVKSVRDANAKFTQWIDAVLEKRWSN